MNIIIAGCGNVGKTLTQQLTCEGHDITVIDIDPSLVELTSNTYDVLGIVGNSSSYSTLKEAGIEDADLLICVTNHDELNLLCCVVAKKAVNCHTIARVRNPIYHDETEFIRKELGISMIVNPELITANEISRLIRFPSAKEVDSFAKDQIEMITLKLPSTSKLCNQSLKNARKIIGLDLLVCIVERDGEAIIPNGDFVLQSDDNISIITSSKGAINFLKKIDFYSNKVRTCIIVGGRDTSVYLAKQLLDMGIKVKIIEQDRNRCDTLSKLLPQAIIICGDGTEKDLLEEEGITSTDAFVSCTDFDEENIMLALYAKSISNAKLVTRIHRVNFNSIIKNLDIGSVVYPRNITSECIIRYVRAMQNSIGSNVETLYKINDDKVEALEFIISNKSEKIINKPLSQLNIKDGVLIGCIQHKGKLITPTGNDVIHAGDSVIIITTILGLREIYDILD